MLDIKGRIASMGLRRRRAQFASVGIAAVGLAGGLVALATANVLLSRRAEHRHPAPGSFIEVDGVKLHYLEHGSGPVVVLIHGNVVSGDDFSISGMLDQLAQDYRVLAFDRPGFGHSRRPYGGVWTAKKQAELLYKALRQLNIVQPIVAGHSLGSLVAMNIALEHPEYIAGLVLMSGYYFPTARPDIPMAGAAAVPILGDLLRFTISPLFARLTMPLTVKAMFAPAKVTDRFRKRFAASMAVRPSSLHAIGADALNIAPDAAKTQDRRGKLSEIPVLILSGRDDHIVSFDHQSARLGREIPSAKLHVVENAGHMIHHSAPDEISEAIRTFVRRT